MRISSQTWARLAVVLCGLLWIAVILSAFFLSRARAQPRETGYAPEVAGFIFGSERLQVRGHLKTFGAVIDPPVLAETPLGLMGAAAEDRTVQAMLFGTSPGTRRLVSLRVKRSYPRGSRPAFSGFLSDFENKFGPPTHVAGQVRHYVSVRGESIAASRRLFADLPSNQSPVCLTAHPTRLSVNDFLLDLREDEPGASSYARALNKRYRPMQARLQLATPMNTFKGALVDMITAAKAGCYFAIRLTVVELGEEPGKLAAYQLEATDNHLLRRIGEASSGSGAIDF